MLPQSEIVSVLEGYDLSQAKIGMIASHSALDVCDGAKDEGFESIAFCQKGRERTYSEYFKTHYDSAGNLVRGMVDRVVVYDKFKEIMAPGEQQKIIDDNILFIPNRSFTSYVDMGEIEANFRVPMFGNRSMLRSEERGEVKNYYWLLEKAGLPFPEKIEDPADIDGLVMDLGLAVGHPRRVTRHERLRLRGPVLLPLLLPLALLRLDRDEAVGGDAMATA